MLSRPTVSQVYEYREYVNQQINTFINGCTVEVWEEASKVIEIGINHEQQHQELILTDLKYLLAQKEKKFPIDSEPVPLTFTQ